MSCSSSLDEIKKASGETLNVSMDFSNQLEDVDTITLVSVSSSPSGITIDNEVVSGQTVQFSIAGGVDGQNYTVSVSVTTSTGETLIGYGPLKIRDI